MPNETLIKALELAEAEYKLLPYRKRFIPIEEIARDPKRYGYGLEPRESKARQGDFISDKSKTVLITAGNRSGKTESGAVKFINNCLERKGRAWSLCPSYDLQKEGTQLKLLDYLKPEQIVKKSYAVGTALKEIKLINGTVISFKTYEQGREKMQSAKLITAWFDEEPPEDIYDEVDTRLIDLQGQMILTFTPLNGKTWSYDALYNSISDRVSRYQWGMFDNPFIPTDEINEKRAKWNHRKVQMRIYGNYVGSESAVWFEFDRERHINKEPMYDPNLPVDITVDFGVVTSACVIGQYQKVIESGKMIDRFVFVAAMEMHNTGYKTMMKLILQRCQQKGYMPNRDSWFCDPAGRQRQQGNKTGSTLLNIIKTEFGIDFSYIKKLGIEESIELVADYMMSDTGLIRFFLDGNITVDEKGNLLAQRIENYVRDENNKPIDDNIVTHVDDCVRYWVANRVRGGLRGRFKQH